MDPSVTDISLQNETIFVFVDNSLICYHKSERDIIVDVGEGTSGTSADIPRFGLEIHTVSSAMIDENDETPII